MYRSCAYFVALVTIIIATSAQARALVSVPNGDCIPKCDSEWGTCEGSTACSVRKLRCMMNCDDFKEVSKSIEASYSPEPTTEGTPIAEAVNTDTAESKEEGDEEKEKFVLDDFLSNFGFFRRPS